MMAIFGVLVNKMDCSKEVAMGVGGVYDDRQTFVVGTSTLNQGGGFVFLVNMNRQCILGFLVPQHLCHILSHKPRLTLLVLHRPYFPELLVPENLYSFVVHLCFIIKRSLPHRRRGPSPDWLLNTKVMQKKSLFSSGLKRE